MDCSEQLKWRPRNDDTRTHIGFLDWGMTGLGKKKQIGNVCSYFPINSFIGSYGQDTTLWMQFEGEFQNIPFHVYIAVVADGHGHDGENASQSVIFHLTLYSKYEKLLEMIIDRDKDSIQLEMNKLYDELDQECQYAHSGTTLSILYIFEWNHQVFALTTNVGDSPILCMKNKHVELFYNSHDWESMSERQFQIRTCKEEGVTIPKVIYGRWNCDNGPRLIDRNGKYLPILMFQGDTDIIDEENRKHIMKEMKKRDMVGGIKTVRQIKTEDYGHCNHGSTALHIYDNGRIHGGIQMTRALGDYSSKLWTDKMKTKPRIVSTPSVTLQEFVAKEEITWIVCSDGVGDAFYWHEIHDFWQNEEGFETTQQKTKAFLEYCIQKGQKFFGRLWDDLSIIVIEMHLT